MAAPTLTCDDPLLRRWYRQLRRDGVVDTAIDQGYAQPQPTTDPYAPQRIMVGQGDQAISCAEIADAVLQRWQRYRQMIEKDLQRPLPWGLHGERGRAIQRDVAWIRQSVAQGWTPGTEVYAQRLGYALYLYALLPTAERMPYFHTYQPDWLDRATQRLRRLGMGAIADRLIARGGLGLGWFAKDLPREGTAMDAVAEQGGACTEKTKVLFALCAEARLTPFVYAMSVQQAMQAWTDLYQGSGVNFQPTPDEELLYHVALGHQDAAQVVTSYDFQPFTGNQELIGTDLETHAHRITPREFFQIDLVNAALQQPDGAAAQENLRLAQWLGASVVDARIAAAAAMRAMALGDRVAAERDVATGLRIVPNDPTLRFLSCAVAREQVSPQETIDCLTPLAADTGAAREQLVQLLVEQGQTAVALPHLERLMRDGTNRAGAALVVGGYYVAQGDVAKAQQFFSQALRLAPHDAATHAKVAVVLAGVQRWAEADAAFQRAARLEPHPVKRTNIWRASIPTQVALGRLPLARHYLARAALAIREIPPSASNYLSLYTEFREAAQLANDWTHVVTAWTALAGRPGLPQWVTAIHMDLLWQQGKTNETLALAKGLSVGSGGFDDRPATDYEAETIVAWDTALRLLPDPFWRAAPAGLIDFFRTMGRWYGEWGETGRARQALEHYMRYTATPRADAVQLLTTLK